MDFLAKMVTAFEHGGIWMWPILGLQMASLAIIAERTYFLFIKRKMGQADYALSYEPLIKQAQMDQAYSKAQQDTLNYPLAKVIAAGVMAARNLGGKDEIQGKMDEVLLHENSIIEKRTGFLTMLGNVATLTGLLGTITGMIRSFAAVSFASPTEKAALLAAGISEAMNCTAYGLIAAIPALIMYAILQNRAGALAEELNQSALKIFNWLSYAYEPIGLRAQKAANHEDKQINV